MRRGDAVAGFHGLDHTLVKPNTAVDAARHDGLEADSRKIALALNVAGLFQLHQAIPNRLRVISHALETAFMQKALLSVREVKQAPFERGRTQIGNENLHECLATGNPQQMVATDLSFISR